MKQSMYGGMVSSSEQFPIPFQEFWGKITALSCEAITAYVLLTWYQLYQLSSGFDDDECQNISGIRYRGDRNNWERVKEELIRIGFVYRDGKLSNPSVIPLIQKEKSEPVLRTKKNRNRFIDDWQRIRSRIIERDKGACVYCGSIEPKMHVDHVVPLSRGGTNDDSNLVTACRSCNVSKHAKTEREWLQ